MADRSAIMRAVKSRDTTPELLVRRLAHSLGFRFRLHRRDLPGNPDLTFPRIHRIIFVNGCFWHGHDCARGARIPKANRSYWTAKINRNRERDARTWKALHALGWKVLVVWECKTKDVDTLTRRIRKFLES